jgi:mannose-6-phosphate isomerase-like protein (cupin superfamily)
MKQAIATSVARARGEGEVLNVLGSPYVIKSSAAETADAFLCIEHEVQPGSGVPPHTHTHEDEVFYVLEGEITFEGADLTTPLRLGAGGFLFAPRGRLHTFRNESEVAARMLVLVMPGAGLERMFREIDAACRGGGAPPMEEIAAITARAGVLIAS